MKKFLVSLLVLMLFTLPVLGQGGRDYHARILTVSRWIDLSGRWFNRVIIGFVDGDTTPSVYNSNIFKEANTSGTTIATFDDGRAGQQIAILFTTANTIVDFTGTDLLGNGGVDWTSAANSILTGFYDGTNWFCEVSTPSAFTGPIQVPRIGIGEAPDAVDPIEMTSSSTASYNGIDFEPTGAMTASQVFRGFYLNGAALDPSGADAEVYGIRIDFTGVDLTNDPELEGLRIDMPVTYTGQEDHCAAEFTGNGMVVEIIENDRAKNALHIEGGSVDIDRDLPNTANTSFTALNIDLVVDQLAATSLIHAVNVNAVGAFAGEVAALGVNPGVDPIHQHTGTFVTPDQAEYAARWPDGGAWTDGIDTHQIFVADDDEIHIGSATIFDSLGVILTVAATKDVFVEYYFYDTGLSWVEFFPEDTTNGYRSDGIVGWDSADLTNWKSDYDPGAADGSAGYYIKVKRTRVMVVGPTITTIKILASTEYEWDEDGDLNVRQIVSTNSQYVWTNSHNPEADGGDNDTVELGRADATNNRLYNRTIGIQDTQDMDWYGETSVVQTPTSLTLYTRASDFANCVVTMTIEDQGGAADATGAVTITPTGNDTWEEFTYTFTSTYTFEEELWIKISITSLDTADTVDFGRCKINY